jgi:hypothetical protein
MEMACSIGTGVSCRAVEKLFAERLPVELNGAGLQD